MEIEEERQFPPVSYSDNQSSQDDGMDWGERWRHEHERQNEEHGELIQMAQQLLQEQICEQDDMDDYASALAAVDEAEQAENDFVAACFVEQLGEEATGFADIPQVDHVGNWV